jgi:hypothetical protein
MGEMVHELEVGAKRFVDGISDARYKSGVFYASKEGKLSGDMVDQNTFFTSLKNTSFQDNAYDAIHRFINSPARPALQSAPPIPKRSVG